MYNIKGLALHCLFEAICSHRPSGNLDAPPRRPLPSPQDNLDADLPLSDQQSLARGLSRCYSQSAVASHPPSLMSPEPPYSPTKSCGDALVLSEDLHEHLIREDRQNSN